MQTIFPGHFPKASENTALSEYSFSWRITNCQPKSWETYTQVQSKNTITSEKQKKPKEKNGSVILKIKWSGGISSLCLSISVAYGFCTLHESQWSVKCKSQVHSTLKKNSQKLLFLSTALIQRPEWTGFINMGYSWKPAQPSMPATRYFLCE